MVARSGHAYCGLFMAQTSDNLARKYGITREQQDEFALRSHQLGNEATQNGRFAEEIVAGRGEAGQEVGEASTKDDHLFPCDHDRGPRRAAAGVRPRVDRHRRQRVRHRRRRGRGGRDHGRSGEGRGQEDARDRARLRQRRRRARHDGHRPRTRDPQGGRARAASRSRTSTCSRSTRRSRASTWRSRRCWGWIATTRQRERRRDRARPPAGRHRHPPHLYAAARAGPSGTKRCGVASACIGGGQGIAVIVERT